VAGLPGSGGRRGAANSRRLVPPGTPRSVRSRSGRRTGSEQSCGRILIMMNHARAATRRFLPTSPFNTPSAASPAEQFAVQDQVTHDKYGLGRVIGVEDDTALVVDFGSRHVRIVTPCAKLTKLGYRRRRPVGTATSRSRARLGCGPGLQSGLAWIHARRPRRYAQTGDVLHSSAIRDATVHQTSRWTRASRNAVQALSPDAGLQSVVNQPTAAARVAADRCGSGAWTLRSPCRA
jgi:hypothetical protein